MVKTRSNTLQPLHTRPLQSFKVIEDMTITLHQDIQRQYQYCMVMYGNTEVLDQAIRSSMEEMYDAVRDYESKISYLVCGEGEMNIWAGSGNRVMRAALWNKVEKVRAQPSIPHAVYNSVVAQIREELVWCEECSVAELKTSGVPFDSTPSRRSLAKELDEDDRELVESWCGEERLKNGGEAEVGYWIASEKTRGSNTKTSERNSEITPSPEPVEDEGGVLLANEYGCYIDSHGRCCCPRPPIVYL
jgi:hypothetical protein